MDSNRFLDETVTPVLKQMDMWSAEAEKLLIMTACHESGGYQYRVQVNGPALSYFQIEPASFSDMWDRYLADKPDRKEKVAQFLPEGMDTLEALEKDDQFACASARMIYAMEPTAIPHVKDDVGLSEYCKTYWNTELGKATPEKYLDDFRLYGPDPEPEGWS